MLSSVIVHVCLQGYGSSFIKQYVMDSGAGGDMNVGEFWSDMHWEDGGETHSRAACMQ